MMKSNNATLGDDKRNFSRWFGELREFLKGRFSLEEDQEAQSEVGALMHNIGTISLTKGITFDMDGAPRDTTLICVVTPKNSTEAIDRATLESWLKIRTKVEHIRLFIDLKSL